MDDDWFWITEADPSVDICDSTVTVGASIAEIIPHALKHVDAPSRVLEVGCGIGRLTVPVQQLIPGAVVIGTDISVRMLGVADSAGNASSVRPLHLLTGTLDVFGSSIFDIVYSMCVFQHIDNDRKRSYVEQIARVLRPGGVMVIQYVEGTHSSRCMYDVLTEDVVSWCGEYGLKVEEIRHDNLMPRWSWVDAVK